MAFFALSKLVLDVDGRGFLWFWKTLPTGSGAGPGEHLLALFRSLRFSALLQSGFDSVEDHDFHAALCHFSDKRVMSATVDAAARSYQQPESLFATEVALAVAYSGMVLDCPSPELYPKQVAKSASDAVYWATRSEPGLVGVIRGELGIFDTIPSSFDWLNVSSYPYDPLGHRGLLISEIGKMPGFAALSRWLGERYEGKPIDLEAVRSLLEDAEVLYVENPDAGSLPSGAETTFRERGEAVFGVYLALRELLFSLPEDMDSRIISGLNPPFGLVELVQEAYRFCSTSYPLRYLYDEARERAVLVAVDTVNSFPESLWWLHDELERIRSGCSEVWASYPGYSVGCVDYMGWAREPYPERL